MSILKSIDLLEWIKRKGLDYSIEDEVREMGFNYNEKISLGFIVSIINAATLLVISNIIVLFNHIKGTPPIYEHIIVSVLF